MSVTRLSLLAFVAAHGDRGVRRDTILLTFWGDSEQERARNALKQAVFALRKYAGRSDLLLGVDQLRVNPEALETDVAHFRIALDAKKLEDAVKLYTGDFLEGVHVRAAPEFDEWRDLQQSALRDEYQAALRQLAQKADASGKVDEAVRYWKLLKASAPLDSRAALALVRALNAAGDRAGAMLSAREHDASLQRELGLSPDPEFSRAVSAIIETPGTSEGAPLRRSRSYPNEAEVASSGYSTAPVVPIARMRRKNGWPWSIAAGVAAAVLATIAFFYANRGTPRVTTALVIAFDNRTGDRSLDAFGSLVADFAASELSSSGLMPVAPTLNSLSTAPGSARKATSADLALKAVTTDGFSYAVGGYFYRSKDSITITPVIVSSRTRSMLASVRPIRVAAVDLNGSAERVAQLVAGAIASATDERVSTLRVASERAPRYDAYAQFVQGLELFHDDHRKDAFDAFARARTLDSSFVLPIIWQTFSAGWAGQTRDSLIRALSVYGEKLSPLERYGATYLRAELDDNQRAALQAALRAASLAPGSNWSYIAAQSLSRFNREEEALRILSSVRPGTWVGNWPAFWRYYIATAHRAGNDALARRLVKQATEFDVSRLVLLRFHAMLEAAAGNDAGVNQDYDAYAAATQSRDSLLHFFAIAVNEADYHGHPALQRRLGDSLISYVAIPGDTSAERVGMLADAYATVGRAAEAYPFAVRYRAKTADITRAMGLLGLIAARTNRRTIALAYLDSLASRRNESKGEPAITRARIAAALHDTVTAMTLLRQAYGERGQIMWQHDSDFDELRGYSEYERMRHPEAEEGITGPSRN